MKIIRTIRFILLSFMVAALYSCGTETSSDLSAEVSVLLSDASQSLASQDFETAMDKSLQALALSGDDPFLQVQSLYSIIGIDIMASRDADAWEKALQAETLARDNGFTKELSAILVSKAKLCSYAEISPETGRNDEGLGYAMEALRLAKEADAVKEQCEACYVIGSLYINKNRWSDPIDQTIYRTAGEWLARGQALADTHDMHSLRRNGILFRSRWFQQGGRNEEAIIYFEQILEELEDTDYLMASAIDDRLVRLYTRVGRHQDALDIHDDYVYQMQNYIRQKQDETVQEMQTRFEVQEKEYIIERNQYKVTLLILALAVCAAAIILIVFRARVIRRHNAELKHVSDLREQIIELLTKDLRSPSGEVRGKIADLSSMASTLSLEEIRDRCEDLARNVEDINSDVAEYIGDVLIYRSKRIADVGLTAREIQIIRLSAEGLTAAQIADKVFLSVNTVNTHRQRIYRKMDVSNVSDMIRKATELGII